MPKKERSPETILLAGYLENCFIDNEVALYSEMEKLVEGCTDNGYKRYFLNAAIAYVKKEFGYMYECITMVGYQPIPNTGRVVKIEKNRRGRIKNQVKKWDFELSTINVAKLEQPEREKFFASQLKVSAYQLIQDEKLEQTFADAGRKYCAGTGKIDMGFDDVRRAFKALAF